MTSYYYRAYGLVFECDRKIYPLPECTPSTADVQIRSGTLPDWAKGLNFDVSNANWSASQDRFHLQVDGIAEYLVLNGNEIWIQAANNVPDPDVDAFLVSSAFAALLQQRQLLTLHASAVSTDRGAVLIAGRSGIGKSTTLAALSRHGFPMVTDDIAAITCDEAMTIIPSFPHMKVRQDALEALGDTNTYRPVRQDVEKYIVPAAAFETEPKPIAQIFVVGIHNAPEISIVPMGFTDAFKWLTEYTFRRRFYEGLHLAEFHFASLSRLIGTVRISRVKRPGNQYDLDGLVDRLIAEFDHGPTKRPAAAG